MGTYNNFRMSEEYQDRKKATHSLEDID